MLTCTRGPPRNRHSNSKFRCSRDVFETKTKVCCMETPWMAIPRRIVNLLQPLHLHPSHYNCLSLAGSTPRSCSALKVSADICTMPTWNVSIWKRSKRSVGERYALATTCTPEEKTNKQTNRWCSVSWYIGSTYIHCKSDSLISLSTPPHMREGFNFLLIADSWYLQLQLILKHIKKSHRECLREREREWPSFTFRIEKLWSSLTLSRVVQMCYKLFVLLWVLRRS